MKRLLRPALIFAACACALALLVIRIVIPGVAHGVRASQAYQDFVLFESDLSAYREKGKELPPDLEVLVKELYPHYGRLPIDPWGNHYTYRRVRKSDRDMPEFLSSGPDGTFGTKDDLSSLDTGTRK